MPERHRRLLLEDCVLPGDLVAQVAAVIDRDNHQRYHKGRNIVTPADICFGRDKAIIKQQDGLNSHS
ncbi:MAG: hypothetical protein AAGF88_13250 [Pseudomonadota bacterium]